LNQTCTNGACVTNACNGCVDKTTGQCETGTTSQDCGTGGNPCATCASGQTCDATTHTCVATSSCSHSECNKGTKLVNGCDTCVTEICAKDSYCCTVKWDSICVREVKSICGKACK
jgi:hypothetical protein